MRPSALRWPALVVAAVVLTGCSASYDPTDVPESRNTPSTSRTQTAQCSDARASYEPMSLPPAGQMPTTSSMGRIADRGRLIAGVSSDTLSMATRNPRTGDIEGFEIDLARAIARAIFGDENRLELRVLTAAEIPDALVRSEVDVVVDQLSPSCGGWEKYAMSAPYLSTSLRGLTTPNLSKVPRERHGELRWCAPAGTTAEQRINGPKVLGRTWSDCLMRFQRAEADGVIAPRPIAAGLARQDPYAVLVDHPGHEEQLVVGAPRDKVDLVRFVNALLEQRASNGEWQKSYDTWVKPYAGDARPPTPTYGRPS